MQEINEWEKGEKVQEAQREAVISSQAEQIRDEPEKGLDSEMEWFLCKVKIRTLSAKKLKILASQELSLKTWDIISHLGHRKGVSFYLLLFFVRGFLSLFSESYARHFV